MTTRTKLGVIGTLAWVAVIAAFLICYRDDWASMELSAWGDFFAGFLAPVAFLWLILGYLQQGD